jgi:hypothetical protein
MPMRRVFSAASRGLEAIRPKARAVMRGSFFMVVSRELLLVLASVKKKLERDLLYL